jgi:hypothetical protein
MANTANSTTKSTANTVSPSKETVGDTSSVKGTDVTSNGNPEGGNTAVERVVSTQPQQIVADKKDIDMSASTSTGNSAEAVAQVDESTWMAIDNMNPDSASGVAGVVGGNTQVGITSTQNTPVGTEAEPNFWNHTGASRVQLADPVLKSAAYMLAEDGSVVAQREAYADAAKNQEELVAKMKQTF